MVGGGSIAAEGMWAFALSMKHGSCFCCRATGLARNRSICCRPGRRTLFRLRDQVYRGAARDGDASQRRPSAAATWSTATSRSTRIPHSFFTDVTELRPGSVLSVSADGGKIVDRYWRPGALAIDETLSYGDCVELVREALIRSVKLRLRADVPLAFCI